MLDFTQAFYLGIRHPWAVLRPWNSLTMGVPSALKSPVEATRIAQGFSRLMGHDHGVVGRSTLHLFFDLLDLFGQRPVTIFIDLGVYPIARWAAELAAQRVPVTGFRHLDADALARHLQRNCVHARRPVVVTDGWCPRCGKAAPVDRYLDLVRTYGGWVIVDDTQALGILGRRGREVAPYGLGGGGIAPWLGITSPRLVTIASLAKGFAAPIAILASCHTLVENFKANSLTRVHSSPPSIADLRAAERALTLNVSAGDESRRRLLQRVQFFRRRLRDVGLSSKGSVFPVQSLSVVEGLDLCLLHRRLADQGIRALLLRRDPPHQMEMAFIINASHDFGEIERAVIALDRCIRHSFSTSGNLGCRMNTAWKKE